MTVSQHPSAVKARCWRERKRRERAGCVFVTVAVSPCQVRALRRLGLVAGDPDDWLEPRPDAASLARAVRQLLDAADPLAKVAGALRPAHGVAIERNAGCLRTVEIQAQSATPGAILDECRQRAGMVEEWP